MRSDRSPQPGDVVRLDGHYSGVKPGALAVIDGSHFGIDFEEGKGPEVLACFGASAFRGRSSSFSTKSEYVSCSGGPVPFVPFSALTYAGQIDREFWRWIDIPRAGGGESYTLTVNLWTWAGAA